MKLLAFDTCLDKTYVTLYNGENFVNKVILSNEKNYHSAYLISTIIEILKSESLEPKDLDYISTDIGPGSFTGIRACTTVARMLAQQLNIKLVGVSSLEILSRILDGNDLVALDARKNKAYLFDGEILGAVELEKVVEAIYNLFLMKNSFTNLILITDILLNRYNNVTTSQNNYFNMSKKFVASILKDKEN